MTKNLLLLLPLLLAGCSGGAGGVVTLSAVDREGRNPGSFNFAVVNGDGKVVWSGVPAESLTVRNSVKGGSYRVLVVSASGAAVEDLDVSGDETLTVHLQGGGAVRGEVRKGGAPIAAQVFMPIPGKGADPTAALSRIVRSNADGRFQIDRLPPGTWTLVVGTSAAGYKEFQVTVEEGKVAEAGYVEIP